MADNNPLNTNPQFNKKQNEQTPNLNRLFQTAGTQRQAQGTGYTNLGKLMSSNQSNNLGQAVTSGIQQQVGGIKTELQKQQEQFQKEAEKNRLGSEEDVAKREATIGRFASPSGAGGPVTEQDVGAFERFRSGTYGGPTSLKDTSALSSQAQALKEQTSNLTPSGTQELLRRTVGRPDYTQGQQRLDTLLMGQANLRPAQREAQNLTGQISQANAAALGQAQQYKAGAEQFAKETEGKLQAAMGGIDTSVQGQLKAAQEAEKQRQANIQAIQNFAANRTPKLDASGNVMKDQYGNTVYDTSVNARGTSDTAGQLDYLKNLLSSKGIQSDELQSMFGVGDIAKGESERQKQIDSLNKQYILNYIADYATQGALGGMSGSDVITSNPELFQKYVDSNENGTRINAYKFNNAIRQGLLTPEQINEFKLIERGTENPAILGSLYDIGQERSKSDAEYANRWLNPETNKVNQAFYGSRGIAGQALQGGKQEDLYKNLAATLANSQQAHNLTEQGVASAQQRANYEALARLMGQTTPKYSTANAQNYEAGKLLLNPDQIKKALGY